MRQVGIYPSTLQGQVLGTTLPESVRAALGGRAAERPLVIILEDVHRADSASLGLLLGVCRIRLPPRVTLLVSARHPDVSPVHTWAGTLADLARLPAVSVLELTPLDQQGVGDLVSSRLAHLDAPSRHRLSALLYERSGGNALHVAAVLDVIAGLPDEAACRTAASLVPERLVPLIRYQLGSLPANTRDVLEALAVVGRGDAAVLGELVGRPPADVLRMIRPALDLGLVTDESGSFRLRHALTEQAVHEATPQSSRQYLHLAVLERLGADATDPFVVLRHALGAGALVDRQRLGAAALGGARSAYGRGAFAEALTLASSASEHLDLDDRLTADLYRGLALAALGRVDEADEALDEVVERSLDRDTELAILAAVGHEPLGIRVQGDARRLARLHHVFAARRAARSSFQLDLVRALIIEERLVHGDVRTEAVKDELTRLSTALASDAERARVAQLDARDLVEAPVLASVRLQAAERALEAAIGADDMLLRLDALELVASGALAAAELERCRDVVWELSRTAEKTGRPRSRWISRLLEAALLVVVGDEGGDTAAQKAMELGISLGITDAVGAYGVHMVACQLLAGDLAPLLPLIQHAVITYPNIAAWRAAAALALVHTGNLAGSREQLRQFFDIRRASSMRYFDRPGLCLAAHAAVELGDAEGADEVLQALHPDRATIVVGAGAAVLGPVTLSVGLAELALGERDRAASHLHEATLLARELGWEPWVRACARWTARLAQDDPARTYPGGAGNAASRHIGR